jgi:heptaprenyl diphosphate synthase
MTMKKISIPSAIDHTDSVAFFAAISIFLSSIEYIIPKPLPFLRIGLANLPVIICLGFLSPKKIVLLVLLKVIGQGIITGTLFSYIFIFSFFGSFASAITMLIFYNIFKRHISLIGVSISGAMANNSTQLLLASLLAFGRNAVLIAPPFLLVGIISATILGVLAQIYTKKSRWLNSLKGTQDASKLLSEKK